MSIRNTFARLSAAATLMLIGAHTSLAQRIEPVAASSRSVPTDGMSRRQSTENQGRSRPLVTLGGVSGGVIGGGAGFLGGMLAGATLGSRGCSGEDCGLGTAILGAALGEAIGLAVGTHLGSASRGDLLLATLTSTAIGAAGLVAAFSAEGSASTILVAVPVVQLLAVLAIER
jgi:hypothetical protein